MLLRTIGLLILLAVPAVAQQQDASPICGPFAQILQQIGASKYHEKPVFQGDGGDGNMMVLWLNQETGSWAVMTASPAKGVGCISAGGMKSKVIETIRAIGRST
jgi:hypothetical protein